MSRSGIYSSIHYYEREIDSCNGQIRTLQEKLNRLDALRMKFSDLFSNFTSRQAARNNSLNGMNGAFPNVLTAQRYQSGMSALLTGGGYTRACSGINEAQSRVSTEMNSIQNKIYSLNDSISYCRGRISNLYDELSRLDEDDD